MTVSRRNFLKAVGITGGCFTFGGAGLLAAPSENLLPPPSEYTEAKKEVYHQLYGGSPSGTAIEPYTRDIEVLDLPRYPYSDKDALIPEIWAQTALDILHKNMVIGNLVHRDFVNMAAKDGDVVHVRKPMPFVMRRKTDEDPLSFEMETTQRIIAPLDAHFYSSFILRDSDASMSFQDLVTSFVCPSMISMAQGIDRYAIEKMWIEGDKNVVTNHNFQELILDTRMRLNENKTFQRDRHMIVPASWRILKFVEHTDPLRYLGFDLYENVDIDQGLAFHQSALVLLNRPMACSTNLGSRVAGTVSNDISMRCSMQYDMMKAGTRVTFDTLFGAAVMEPKMIVVAKCGHGQRDLDAYRRRMDAIEEG